MEAELIFRLIFTGVFASGLTISTYYRSLARISGEVIYTREEGTIVLLLRALIAIPMLLAILLYAFLPGSMNWSAIILPDWMRWLGAGMGIACIPLIWWVFSSIGSNISETTLTKRGHRLVMEGPYR